jgi:transcriptional regulator with XRE-family HTH domain
MAKRNEICVTKLGRELLGEKMLIDRQRTFGSQDALLEYFEEIFEFKFPKATLSSLENGRSSPTVDNLMILARFATLSSLNGKPFLINPRSGRPFSYGELMEILSEELNPFTGEKNQPQFHHRSRSDYSHRFTYNERR